MAKGSALKKPAAASRKRQVVANKKPAALQRQKSSVNVEATAVNLKEPPRRTEHGLHFREVCHRLYLEWDDARQNSMSYKTMGPKGRPNVLLLCKTQCGTSTQKVESGSEFEFCS